MASRRMFARSIIESDEFTSLPFSAQALYLQFGVSADDDGIVNNPKRIQRSIGAADDDLALLIGKRYLIAFPSGVVAIRHWHINNYLRGDRYRPSDFQDEMQQLAKDANGVYMLASDLESSHNSTDESPGGIPGGAPVGIPGGAPVVDAVKDRVGKVSKGKLSQSKEGGKPPRNPKFKRGGSVDDAELAELASRL